MKKSVIYLAVAYVGCGLLLSSHLHSQSPNWAWAHIGKGGDSGNEIANAVTTDAAGNVYVAGSFTSSSVSFDSHSLTNANGGAGSADIFFVKYDAAGSVVWAKGAGGNGYDAAYSIARDASGNFYLAGSFSSSSITFDSVTLSNPGGSGAIFYVKFDANGSALAGKCFGGSGDDGANSVAVDASGNIYMTGYFSSSSVTFGTTTLSNSGGADIFTVKCDAGGNPLWARGAGGSSDDQAASVAVDASGNSYVAGYYKSSAISLGSVTLNNTGTNNNIFLAKYNGSGSVAWAKGAGDVHDDRATSVAVDASGNVFMAGFFEDANITFGSISMSGGWFRMFFVKFDANGNAVWGHDVGGSDENYASAVTTDAAGNVYGAGYFSGQPIVFGNDILYPTSYDVAVLKFDPAGNPVWAKGAGGWDNDDAFAVTVDPFGNAIVVGGFYSGSIDFGSTTLTNQYPSIADMFIAKIGNNATAMETTENPNDFFIYPGISSGQFTIGTKNTETTLTGYEIYNAIGERTCADEIYGTKKLLLDLDIPDGIYFVKVSTENTSTIKKIIIAK